MNYAMEVKKINVSYKETPVLNNVSLSFVPKKITALIGPSGCGKTTLLKSLNRLLEEEFEAHVTGEILFNGINIKEIPHETLRQKIGIVFQTPTPFPFSIKKNMTYALKYHQNNKAGDVNNIIIEKLKLAGLYEEVKNRMNLSASKLSGGQQQRLCIARSLTLNPDILLLDEPCSSLDPKATARIEEALLNLSKSITVIIVTHNLAQARRIADNIAFFSDGELVEYKPTKDFFLNPEKEQTKQYLQGDILAEIK